MAIKINNDTVIDNNKNINAGIGTFTKLDVTPSALTFSPADNSTGQEFTGVVIEIGFDMPLEKNTGNITLRDGSAGGTVLQTISVGAAAVSISGATVTITLQSALPANTNVYVVVDEGAFFGLTFDSQTSLINTYNFTTRSVSLGDDFEGGKLICKSGGVQWIASTIAIQRNWYNRNNAITCAQSATGCTGWFIPSNSQNQNPGYVCRTYWPCSACGNFWSSTEINATHAGMNRFAFNDTPNYRGTKNIANYWLVPFRCVTY